MEERPTGLKSRTTADEDAEIEHNPHYFFFLRKFYKLYYEKRVAQMVEQQT